MKVIFFKSLSNSVKRYFEFLKNILKNICVLKFKTIKKMENNTFEENCKENDIACNSDSVEPVTTETNLNISNSEVETEINQKFFSRLEKIENLLLSQNKSFTTSDQKIDEINEKVDSVNSKHQEMFDELS